MSSSGRLSSCDRARHLVRPGVRGRPASRYPSTPARRPAAGIVTLGDQRGMQTDGSGVWLKRVRQARASRAAWPRLPCCPCSGSPPPSPCWRSPRESGRCRDHRSRRRARCSACSRTCVQTAELWSPSATRWRRGHGRWPSPRWSRYLSGWPSGPAVTGQLLSRLTVEFLRPIPSVALIPVLVLVYGTRSSLTIALGAFAAAFPLLFQAMYGIADVDPVALDTGRVFRMGRVVRMRWIVLPSCAPYLATGLRISASVALILVVTGEYMVGVPGLGQKVLVTQSGAAYDQMYAWIVVTGLVGLLVNLAFHADRAPLPVVAPEPASPTGRRPVTRTWSGRLALQLVLPARLARRLVVDVRRQHLVSVPAAARHRREPAGGLDLRAGGERPGARASGGSAPATCSPRPPGVVAGTLIGLAPRLRRTTLPVTEFVRSIPSPLLLPFALVVFGIGNGVQGRADRARVGVAGAVEHGRRRPRCGSRGPRRGPQLRHRPADADQPGDPAGGQPQDRGRAAHRPVGGAPPHGRQRDAGGTNGLGFQIRSAQRSFDTADAYAGVIVIGAVGLVVNLIFLAVERRLMRWHRGARGLLAENRGRLA